MALLTLYVRTSSQQFPPDFKWKRGYAKIFLIIRMDPEKKKFVSNELYTWTFLYKNLGNVINQLHNQDRFTHFSSTEKEKLLDN